MRVAVFFHPGDEEIATKVLRVMKELGISGAAYRIHPWWKDDAADRLLGVLNASTHILLVVPPSIDERSGDLSWLFFLAGFCVAKTRYVYYLVLEGRVHVPPFLRSIEGITSLEGVRSAFLRGKEEWLAEQEQEKARLFLKEQDIPLSAEGFIECVKKEKVDALEKFFLLGFSPDTCDRKGVPALCHAVRVRSLEVVNLLLAHGADVNAVSGDRGNTAIMDAAADGNREIVVRLLQEDPDLDVQSKNGQTALILAIGQGALDIAELLVDRGADVTLRDSLGMTARRYAELFRYHDLARKIKEREYDFQKA
ncbi:ankyrin repeat domain-containing protein [Spirochaeta thermophila]|nr:ankyrin repeat domain-containing protein [Spirochaeta thermophila]